MTKELNQIEQARNLVVSIRKKVEDYAPNSGAAGEQAEYLITECKRLYNDFTNLINLMD